MVKRKTRFGILGQVIILVMATLVISVPVMRAAHSHTDIHELSLCEDHHHGDKQKPGSHGTACPQCEFYSHFVPVGAGSVPVFAFDNPMVPVPLLFGEAGNHMPCKGKLQCFTNKDPPRRS